MMKKNNNPSIYNCCNGLINFSIYPMEKLVCNLECENGRINEISRWIECHV